MKLTNYGQSVLFKIYAFLVYLVPMLILFFCNMDAYTSDSAFSFFGIVLIGFVAIAFCGTLKKIFNYNIGLSISAIIFVVALMSKYLGEQLLLISGCSFIGSVFSLVFGAISNTYYRLAFIVDENGRRRKDKAPALPFSEIWRETLYINSK
jgi:hypothetical protein